MIGDERAPATMAAGHPTETVVPIIEERLQVGRRIVETGQVRISLTTETVEDVIRQALVTRTAEVERVPIGREVSEAPQTRQEGDVLIIPVVEEILVVERRLVLKEEIRLRIAEREEIVEQTVPRRVQHARIERVPAGQTASPPGPVGDNNENPQEP